MTPVAPVADTDRSRVSLLGAGSTYEWQSACTARHSLLIEGPSELTDAALRLLTPHLLEPVVLARSATEFEPPAGECRTLVLKDVFALSIHEQERLRTWLDGDGRSRKQVISTSAQPLFPLVEGGLFDDVLYYRLNVMLLQINDTTLQAAR